MERTQTGHQQGDEEEGREGVDSEGVRVQLYYIIGLTTCQSEA